MAKPIAIVASSANDIAIINAEKTYFVGAGDAFGKSALSEGRRLTEFAEHMTAHGSTFEGFAQARAWFVQGATAAGYLDAEKLFERTANAARALGLLGAKPKAAAAASVKKAESRDARAAQVVELTAKHTPAELRKMAAELLIKGEDARAVVAAAEKATKSASDAARDAASEKVKALRTRINDAVARLAKSGRVAALEKIATAAEKASPAPAAAKV